MRDVVIIGGGLSGLAAAYELHQRGITFTLIEVKPRLGGSIASHPQDGFIVDSGLMFTPDRLDTPFLAELGLTDEVILARQQPDDLDEAYIAFKHGMQTLIDRLAKPLVTPDSRHLLMMRMAVSTIGRMDILPNSRLAICMENGMVLDAKTIIVAAPARYAERIFHTLKPEISFRLLDYRYDDIAHVSLGYRVEDAPHIPSDPPADYPISYVHALTHDQTPERVPFGHVLIQAGIRYDPSKGIAPDVVGQLAALMGWELNPAIERVTVWKESDPVMWLDDTHPLTMETIQHLLPPDVALAGSDYIPAHRRPTLQDRIDSGKAAAARVAAFLAKAH